MGACILTAIWNVVLGQEMYNRLNCGGLRGHRRLTNTGSTGRDSQFLALSLSFTKVCIYIYILNPHIPPL